MVRLLRGRAAGVPVTIRHSKSSAAIRPRRRSATGADRAASSPRCMASYTQRCHEAAHGSSPGLPVSWHRPARRRRGPVIAVSRRDRPPTTRCDERRPVARGHGQGSDRDRYPRIEVPHAPRSPPAPCPGQCSWSSSARPLSSHLAADTALRLRPRPSAGWSPAGGLPGLPRRPRSGSAAREEPPPPRVPLPARREALLLPTLARQLSTNEEERKAVLELLTQRGRADRQGPRRTGLDRDVAVATAFVMAQLWGLAREPGGLRRGQRSPARPVVRRARRAGDGEDVRLPTSSATGSTASACRLRARHGAEVATEPAAPAGPTLQDHRRGRLRGRGRFAARARRDRRVGPGRRGAGAAAPSPGRGLAWPMEPPRGWAREEAGWATISAPPSSTSRLGRARGGTSDRRHAGEIFVLPPRPAPQGEGALFDWRCGAEQFAAFRARVLFVHYSRSAEERGWSSTTCGRLVRSAAARVRTATTT